METDPKNGNLLGINGLGRIGKLTLWDHLSIRHFDGAVVNIGREAGESLGDLVHAIGTDSTYGSLSSFLYGYSKKCEIRILDEDSGIIEVDGFPIKILRRERNPENINWAKEGVRLVVDCTGRFTDPTLPADDPKGSVRGHLQAGAEKVIITAPYKISPSKKMPEDSTMLVYGVNHTSYDQAKHNIISAASCTTTALAHMIKPLLETEETSRILTASMSTVHAATSTQSILDSVPESGASDLRKNRSIFNNILLTSTGAAKALENVLPEIQRVGFMADSVRIPINTVSLISLNITFHTPLSEKGEPIINQEFLNEVYKRASEGAQRDLLVFSDEQNVSSDLIGYRAAVVIEGHDTHTRTGFIELPVESLQAQGIEDAHEVRIPVTQAKIFGWYDNEFGSYVNCLGKLIIYIDKNMR